MEYDLKLTQQDLQMVLGALGELPIKVASATFGKIHEQILAQDRARAAQSSENNKAA